MQGAQEIISAPFLCTLVALLLFAIYFAMKHNTQT